MTTSLDETAGGGATTDGEGRDFAALLARIKAPDPEEVRRSAERRAAFQDEVAALGGFSPLSLEDWLSLCATAGVDAVPSTILGRVPMAALREFDANPAYGEAMAEAGRALEALEAANPEERYMTRFDGCGDMWLKIAMNDSGEWHPDFARVPSVDDERTYETHAIFMPKPDVPVHARPWADAVKVDGLPLEFRVYVGGGEVLGVSNYHYQRPLPDEPWVVAHAERCLALAATLLAAQTRPVRLIRAVGETADPAVNQWTADFVVLEGRGPVFLEGGPPVAHRANPCCFRGRERIEGIALRLP